MSRFGEQEICEVVFVIIVFAILIIIFLGVYMGGPKVEIRVPKNESTVERGLNNDTNYNRENCCIFQDKKKYHLNCSSAYKHVCPKGSVCEVNDNVQKCTIL